MFKIFMKMWYKLWGCHWNINNETVTDCYKRCSKELHWLVGGHHFHIKAKMSDWRDIWYTSYNLCDLHYIVLNALISLDGIKLHGKNQKLCFDKNTKFLCPAAFFICHLVQAGGKGLAILLFILPASHLFCLWTIWWWTGSLPPNFFYQTMLWVN